MKNNIDLIVLSTIIITIFVIFTIKTYRTITKSKRKEKRSSLSKEVLRKAIVNSLADMESDGVYFNRENINSILSQEYIKKFKKNMKK